MTVIKIFIAILMSTWTVSLWVYCDYLDYKKLHKKTEPFYIPWIFVFIIWILHFVFCLLVFFSFSY